MAASTITPAQILVITTVQEGTYYHESIPTATAALVKSQSTSSTPALSFTVSATPHPHFSTLAHLLAYDAICFLHTMADILTEHEMSVLMQFCARSDKGVVGVHSATATHLTSKQYSAIFGASFTYHPAECTGCVYKPTASQIREAGGQGTEGTEGMQAGQHVTMQQWPQQRREIRDEWYNFSVDPLSVPGNLCLLAVEEDSYVDEGRERVRLGLHAVAWCRERKAEPETEAETEAAKGGEQAREEEEEEGVRCRVWYTSLGHTHEIWEDEAFLRHVLDGMAWAVGRL